MRFADRSDAGSLLAARVAGLRLSDPVVLALARGGVPVGARVAERLGAPLVPLVVRKLGAPFNPELALGALSEDGSIVLDPELTKLSGLDDRRLQELVERELAETRRRIQLYRGGRALPDLSGRDALIVDDGMATGLTTLAAVRTARSHRPRRIVVAVPVTSDSAAELVEREADEVVALHVPADFGGVGRWYSDFTQVTDAEVTACLAPAGAHRAPRPA